MDKKHDIFVSYSRHDTNVVNEFVDRLEREGFSVWIDRDGIESGDAFKRIILQAIKNSAVILFFSSQHSNQSGWTAKEIGVAVKYQKTVIPILLDGSNFNEEVEFDLINLDFIDYQDVAVRGTMMDRLVKSLKAKIPNPIGQKKAEEARLKAEAAERERLERERRQKEEAERKAREEAERKAREEVERQAREAAERERRALQNIPVSPTPHGDTSAPKNKKPLWIALAAAPVVLLLLLLLKPKKEEPVVDPDTQAYEACQTVADYRAYMSDYGRNSLHYVDAKAFVDQYVADSLQRVKDSLAQVEAQLLAQQQAEAEQAENEAYGECTTITACDSYLKNYPQGRYVEEVRTKKAELEAKAAQISVSGSANGHDYVDLGLPSGTLWATCNVGTNKPEGYGNYYAWGETSTKSTYDWSTYQHCAGSEWKLTKYCTRSSYGNNGYTDNLTELQPSDDPATTWGSGWRLPSKAQCEELKKNTTDKWTTRNGVKGRLLTSKKNGHTIFFPAAGRKDGELRNMGSHGYYWSREQRTDEWGHEFVAGYLNCESINGFSLYYIDRSLGISVRPVRQK